MKESVPLWRDRSIAYLPTRRKDVPGAEVFPTDKLEHSSTTMRGEEGGEGGEEVGGRGGELTPSPKELMSLIPGAF